MRIEFRLTMPSVGSWNGRWSGEGKNYTLIRTLTDADVKRLGIPRSWFHSWGDGWGARVEARIMDKGERAKASDGFCGYEWMVDFILRWGDTRCRCEWGPDPSWPGYIRCRYCGTSKKPDALLAAGGEGAKHG